VLHQNLRHVSSSEIIDKAQKRFLQGSQIIVLPASGFFNLFELWYLSFEFLDAMLQRFIGFFPGFLYPTRLYPFGFQPKKSYPSGIPFKTDGHCLSIDNDRHFSCSF
jgi:hypothetical protein